MVALSSRAKRLVFVSSVSSVSNSAASKDSAPIVPEEVVTNDSAPLLMGYSQSKYISEHILANASRITGIPVTILRVGQVAGGVEPREKAQVAPSSQLQSWNKSDWVPALLATSKSIGIIPGDRVPVDWIPVNKVALIIKELFMHDISGIKTLVTYNIVNPCLASWEALLPAINAGLGRKCEVVPFTGWLDAVKSHDAQSGEEARELPALKILSFYEELQKSKHDLRVITEQAANASTTLSQLEPVNGIWMTKWLEQWKL